MSNYNDAFNKAIDELLDEAAHITVEKDSGELEMPTDNISFSDEHEVKMQRLFKSERRKIAAKKFRKYAVRAACIFLALIVFSCATIFSVSAWRVRFLNFVLDIGAPNTDYNFTDEKPAPQMDDRLQLDYIPEGFVIKESVSDDRSINFIFSNEDKFFYVSSDGLNTNFSIDTENALVERIKINGFDAVYTANQNANTLIWHDDDRAYTITGNISKDEIFKIAKGLKNNF